MYTYTLVLMAEDLDNAINAVRSHLHDWDDEMGHVFRVIEAGQLADQRVLVKVITNAQYGTHQCDASLNGWLGQSANRLTRRGDYISGDLVWWGGPLRY